MMGDTLQNFVFGSKPKGPEIVDVNPDEYQGIRGDIAGGIQNLVNSGGGSNFSGPFTAALTKGESSILNQLQQNPGGAGSAGIGTVRDAATSSLDPSQNPILQGMISSAQRGVTEQFQDEVVPGMRAQFTQAGQQVQDTGSSPFQMAAARAAGDYASALGDVSTNIISSERDRQLQAAQSLPQLERTQVDSMLANLEAQALPRMVEQMGIDRGLEEFRRQEQQLLQALQLGGGLSGAQTVTLPGQEGGGGIVPGLASTAGGALGTAIGGPTGGAIGSQIGGQFGSSLQNTYGT